MTRLALPLVALAALVSALPIQAADLRDVFKRVKSSVVVIETRQKEIDPSTAVGLVRVGGMGSGVLISDDGKVATAAHVVQTADEILVHFRSGEKIRARVAASEPGADVALLQLERIPSDAQVALLGDSDRMAVGDQVFVVGAPLGITHSLTVGHISARRLDDKFMNGLISTEVFQTDAAINQGNSGGPMFNMDGRVVGIVSYIVSQGGGFEGLGFAITSKMFRELLLERRALWTGMQGRVLTGDLARIFNLPQPTGVIVEQVAERSLASHLGLRGGFALATVGDERIVVGGDVILAAMGVRVGDPRMRERLDAEFEGLEPGDEITVEVLRDGERVVLKNSFFPDLLVPSTPGD